MNKTELFILSAAILVVFSLCALFAPASRAADGVKSNTDDSRSGYNGLSDAAVNQLAHTTPSTGDVKIIFLLISFADKGFDEDAMSVQQTKQAVFGGEDSTNAAYPFESTAAYYRRASFGALGLDGDVFHFVAKSGASSYRENNGLAYNKLIEEAFAALDDTVDFSGYDSDGDGFIDGLVLSLPAFDDIATQNGVCIPPATYTTSYILPPGGNLPSWDGVRPQTYLINFAQPSNTDEGRRSLNQSVCHLLGHSLGLPDYCNASGADDSGGLKGDAGHELMDDMTGDLSAFSKLILGWLPDSQVRIFEGSSTEAQNFSLSPMNEPGGSCLVIYNNALQNSYLSEYLICEYITPTRNNMDAFENGGIRVMHVQAATEAGADGGQFVYADNGSGYNGDDGIRILKLVGDGQGFFGAGDVLSYGAENFGFYTGSGAALEDPSLEIVFGRAGRAAELTAQRLEDVYYRCLDSDGVTLIYNGFCYKNRPFDLPDAPDKTDDRYEYEFIGWTGYEDGMIASETEMTFVAQYEKRDRIFRYTFFDNDGRTVLKTGEGIYGDSFEPPEVGDKADPGNIFTFLGFEGYAEGMTLTGNVEFKAVYQVTPRTYTYIFLSKDGKKVLKKETAVYGSTIYAPRGDMSFAGFQPGMKLTRDEVFVATGLEPETYVIFGAGAAVLFVAVIMTAVLVTMHLKRRAKLRKDKIKKENDDS